MYRLAWQGLGSIEEIRAWPEHEFRAWVAWLQVENESTTEQVDAAVKD